MWVKMFVVIFICEFMMNFQFWLIVIIYKENIQKI